MPRKITEIPIDEEDTIVDLLYYNGRSYWWAIDFVINSALRFKSTPYGNKFRKLLPAILIVNFEIFPYYYLCRFLFEKVAGFRYLSNGAPDATLSHTIILRQHLGCWRTGSDGNGRKCIVNSYTDSIISHLKKTLNIVSPYCETPSQIINAQILKRVLDNEHKEVKSTFAYSDWTWSIYISTRKAYSHFKKVWKNLKTKREWFSIISHEYNVSVDNLYQLFYTAIVYIIPSNYQYMLITENTVRKENAELLVMIDEYCDGRTFVSVGKDLGIPTIAIQHGVMFNHPGYLAHSKADVYRVKDGIDASIPLADITCVWGEGEQELLYTEGNYPKGSVIVTGNPRYDYLGHAHELYSRDEVCNRFHIDPKKKIVLWTTQCHGNSLDENHRYFREVFSAIKSLENTVLIVKQHPGEGSEYTKLIRQYIIEYQLDSKVIFPNKLSDTTELVYISDVIINKNSTTGQEAVAFHKPMIILDFTDKPDYSEYVKEGVAASSFEKGSLKQVLINIFEKGFHKEENQVKFIRKHMYKIDGSATIRITDLILSQIDKNNMD